jgi:membrane protease YdiL (CAAX protease family)
MRRYAWEALYCLILIGMQVAIALYGSLCDRQQAMQLLDVAILAGGALAVGFWCLMPSRFRSPALGLAFKPGMTRDLGAGVILACAYYVPSLFLPWLCGQVSFGVNPQGAQYMLSGLNPGMAGLLVTLAGFCGFFLNKICGEELGFRGFLFGAMCRKAGLAPATVTNATVFAVWHIPFLVAFQECDAAAVTLRLLWFGVGAVPICLLFAATNNLYAISLYHALVNLKEQILLQRVATGNALFAYTVSDPTLLILWQAVGLGCQVLVAVWFLSKEGAGRDRAGIGPLRGGPGADLERGRLRGAPGPRPHDPRAGRLR